MRLRLSQLVVLITLWSVGQVGAQTEAPEPLAQPDVAETTASNPMVIATRQAPPFAYKDPEGRWSGIAIDLWERIATRNGYDFEYVELGLAPMLDALSTDEVDGAVAALTITRDREEDFDFSHTFYNSGLAIAVPQRNANLFSALVRFVSPQFLLVIAGLLALLMIVGVLIWLAERRTNLQFQRQPLSGIGSGLWWSAVTMTTVGYGDKAPQTLWGRVVGMIWMFTGLIVISTFTAAVTTALTVNELDASIDAVDDLKLKRVLVLDESTSQSFLAGAGIRHRSVDSLTEALEQLAAGAADAVVHDAPILRYEIAAAFPTQLRVLPFSLTRQNYGIALADDSQFREDVNLALLEIISSSGWLAILDNYLGVDY